MKAQQNATGSSKKGLDKFIQSLVKVFLKITHMNLSEEKQLALEQFIKFCLVGLSNTIIGYIINVASLFILQSLHLFPKTDYFIANVVTWILSVLWSFYWNNRFVFNEEKRSGKTIFLALMKCYASYAITGLGVVNILSWLWVDQLGISKYIAPIINLIVTIPINFLLNKFWAFRGKKKA